MEDLAFVLRDIQERLAKLEAGFELAREHRRVHGEGVADALSRIKVLEEAQLDERIGLIEDRNGMPVTDHTAQGRITELASKLDKLEYLDQRVLDAEQRVDFCLRRTYELEEHKAEQLESNDNTTEWLRRFDDRIDMLASKVDTLSDRHAKLEAVADSSDADVREIVREELQKGGWLRAEFNLDRIVSGEPIEGSFTGRVPKETFEHFFHRGQVYGGKDYTSMPCFICRDHGTVPCAEDALRCPKCERSAEASKGIRALPPEAFVKWEPEEMGFQCPLCDEGFSDFVSSDYRPFTIDGKPVCHGCIEDALADRAWRKAEEGA